MISEYLDDPVNMAAAIVHAGDADCLVAGVSAHRNVILRSLIRILGVNRKFKFVFSSAMLISPDNSRVLSFADCSVVAEPKRMELAVIAGETAVRHSRITGEAARVGFISFSTKGDFDHYRVSLVLEAMGTFGRKYKGIDFDGELQIDAALDAKVAEMKTGGSMFDSGANVLVFPNMDAGNAAFKISQKLAGYKAYGPEIHGLNSKAGIVSRACSVEDIVNTAYLTLAESDN